MLYYRNTILIVKLSWDNILIKSPQFKKYRIKFWVWDSRLLLDANFTIQPYFPLIFFTHPTFRQAEVELMIFESWDGNQFISSSSHQTSNYLDPTHLSKIKIKSYSNKVILNPYFSLSTKPWIFFVHLCSFLKISTVY